MKRFAAGLLALAVLAPLAMVAVSEAAPGDRPQRPPAAERPRPDVRAVAIGELREADGESCTLDFHAAALGERARGQLRFHCADHGFYVGGVRTLTVENGAIRAQGGGPLTAPDGTRKAVRYEASISADGSQVTIRVTGRDLDYTLSGRLEGFVRAGAPPAPAAQPAR